ncbi:hypothetical protein OL229_17310 [Neisseriaceae bacterium JH1-16]|nr:hypothetical protein [Neisseriaceae bacterium JH1-16]
MMTVKNNKRVASIQRRHCKAANSVEMSRIPVHSLDRRSLDSENFQPASTGFDADYRLYTAWHDAAVHKALPKPRYAD